MFYGWALLIGGITFCFLAGYWCGRTTERIALARRMLDDWTDS